MCAGPSRSSWIARTLLALMAVLAVVWYARIDLPTRISTDVLDLVPAGEREPELALVRALASNEQARVALFVLDLPDAPTRTAAGTVFVESLRASPAFAEVTPFADSGYRTDIGRQLYAQRLDLLLPTWVERQRAEFARSQSDQAWVEWLAERAATSLEQFLSQPEALGFQDLLASDPLLLLPGLASSLSGPVADQPMAPNRVLIWARTAAPPMQEAGQLPMLAAVETALNAARQHTPAVTLQWTAIGRFAAASRQRIEGELSGLNVVSIVAVLVIAAVSLRRLWQTAHLIPVVLGGFLGAWIATTLLFERVHVLVFVVGALLGGIVIDYGFYLHLQPPRSPGETSRDKVRRLLKPLLSSALTTILGFSLLLLADLPLLRQLGVFVSAGLLTALGTAVLWFIQREQPHFETRAFIAWRPRTTPLLRSLARVTLALIALIATFALWRSQWHDEVREFEIPAPALHAEDQIVRRLFGETPGRSIYLTMGRTLQEARGALESFSAWHAERHPDAPLTSLGLIVPTSTDWQARSHYPDELGSFAGAFLGALERHGFDPAGFKPFFDTWQSWLATPTPAYDSVLETFGHALQGPARMLMSNTPAKSWFVSMAEHPALHDPPDATDTVSVSQLTTLNRLVGRYRQSAVQLSLYGLALVGVSVIAIYGWKRGPRIFAVSAGACLTVFGAFALTGQTLNLFHLLGAFLGVCLSHNYAIFSAENAANGDAPPPSIRLSALTTAGSFGVLAFSEIPVVSALGTTVAWIVVTALLIVEADLIAFPSRQP